MKKVLLILSLVLSLIACGKKYTNEEVKEYMKKALHKTYGKEFEVGFVALRDINGEKVYYAQTYLKDGSSDEVYEASVDLKDVGKPGRVYSDYFQEMTSNKTEDILLPKAKEIFGNRIRIISDYTYNVMEKDYLHRYTFENLNTALYKLKEAPKGKAWIELKLYIYIYDRIDDEQEKEERRKQTYEFVKYLKEKGLGDYLFLDISFRDERILMPSFYKYEDDINKNTSKDKFINALKVLDEELNKTKEEDLINQINSFSKYDIEELNNRELTNYSGFDNFIFNKLSEKKLEISDIEFNWNKDNIYNKYILNIK